MSPMAPSWIRSMAARYPASWRRCVPATTARPFCAASSEEAITACTPCGSTATGFSMNTCFPASIAAARWRARNAGGVASSTRSALPSSTLRNASNPTQHWESLTLILGLSVGSSVAMVARLSRHFARWSGKRSPSATSSMFSLDVRQSFTAPVPRPPQPRRAMRIVFGARRPMDGAWGSAMAAVAAAVVSTNSRRVTSLGCLGVMTGSWRKEYNAEADERSVGEPPAALGKLRIGLVPGGRLRGSGTGSHPRRRVRHGERGVALVADPPVGRAVGAAGPRRGVGRVWSSGRARRDVEPVHPHVVLVPGHFGLTDPERRDGDDARARRGVQRDGAAGYGDHLECHERRRDRIAIRDRAGGSL